MTARPALQTSSPSNRRAPAAPPLSRPPTTTVRRTTSPSSRASPSRSRARSTGWSHSCPSSGPHRACSSVTSSSRRRSGRSDRSQELIAAPYALGLALGIVVPIILFWGFAVMIRRAQEMRYAAQSMTEVAFRLAEPEHIATDRVMMVGQAVRREVQAMGEGIERTLARAVELETLVHTEVNELERAYSENETRIRALVDGLGSEREAVVSHAERVRASIAGAHETLKDELSAASDVIRQNIVDVSGQALRHHRRQRRFADRTHEPERLLAERRARPAHRHDFGPHLDLRRRGRKPARHAYRLADGCDRPRHARAVTDARRSHDRNDLASRQLGPLALRRVRHASSRHRAHARGTWPVASFPVRDARPGARHRHGEAQRRARGPRKADQRHADRPHQGDRADLHGRQAAGQRAARRDEGSYRRRFHRPRRFDFRRCWKSAPRTSPSSLARAAT